MNNILEIVELNKEWKLNKKTKEFLKSITFSVPNNSCTGLIGENGSGKTSILRIIAGLYKPTSYKKIILNNFELESRKFNNFFSYLSVDGFFSNIYFGLQKIEEIFVESGISFFHGLNRTEMKEKINDSAIIKEIKEKKYSEISFGQRKLLNIFFSGIKNNKEGSEVKLIIMDEPFNGLDLKKRLILINRIKELKKQGKSFLISSHDLGDMEKICDNIVLLQKGIIKYEGKLPDNLEEFVVKKFNYDNYDGTIDEKEKNDVIGI